MKNLILTTTVLAILLASCGTSRKSNTVPPPDTPRPVPEVPITSSPVSKEDTVAVIDTMTQKDTVATIDTTVVDPLQGKVLLSQWLPTANYRTLQYKAKCQFSADGKNLPFTAYVRMAKGEKIWISVIGGGILEVARALITPDSVQVLDKLNKVAYVHGVDYLKSLIGVNVDYSTIESILSSKLADTLVAKIVHEDESEIKLSSEPSENIYTELTINKSGKVWSDFNIDFKGMDILSAAAAFDEYQMVKPDLLISMLRNVLIKNTDGSEMTLEMQVSKVEVDQNPAMNFMIPPGYQYK